MTNVWATFGFSRRVQTVLLNAGIDTLLDLMKTSEAKLRSQPNSGPVTVLEIAERVPLIDTTPESLERMRYKVAWHRKYHAAYAARRL